MKVMGIVAGWTFLIMTVMGGSREAVAWPDMPGPSTSGQQVALQAEMEPSMFQGTVEFINPADTSVTIRTDFGRTVVLFSRDCRMADGLKAGDRVRLEPDAAGAVMVTAMDRRPVGGDASPPGLSRHLAWSRSQCSEGVI